MICDGRITINSRFETRLLHMFTNRSRRMQNWLFSSALRLFVPSRHLSLPVIPCLSEFLFRIHVVRQDAKRLELRDFLFHSFSRQRHQYFPTNGSNKVYFAFRHDHFMSSSSPLNLLESLPRWQMQHQSLANALPSDVRSKNTITGLRHTWFLGHFHKIWIVLQFSEDFSFYIYFILS